MLIDIVEKPDRIHYMEGFEQNLPNEVIINNGQGLLVKKKTLFHGSILPNLDKLNPAKETTVGEGVYLTSEHEKAQGYANHRSKFNKGNPTVYGVNIENLKFLDLRKVENVKIISKGFLKIIENERKNKKLNWVQETVIEEAIKKIQTNKIYAGNIREIAFNLGNYFTDYVKSLGYDGLITFEGGEGDIGDHDTWLVFDTEKIKKLNIVNQSQS